MNHYWFRGVSNRFRVKFSQIQATLKPHFTSQPWNITKSRPQDIFLYQGTIVLAWPRRGLDSVSSYSFSPSTGRSCSLCINSEQNKGPSSVHLWNNPLPPDINKLLSFYFINSMNVAYTGQSKFPQDFMFSVPCCVLW